MLSVECREDIEMMLCDPLRHAMFIHHQFDVCRDGIDCAAQILPVFVLSTLDMCRGLTTRTRF